MKIETVDGIKKIWVRQSWLNDLMICPERARLGIQMPEWRQSSDATHIGTSVHSGIEHILTGNSDKDGVGVAMETLRTLIDTEPFRMNSTSSVDEMEFHVANMMATFSIEILPLVEVGGMVEKTFATKLTDVEENVELWLSGTIDYIEPNGTVWDWKTNYGVMTRAKKSVGQIVPIVRTKQHVDWLIHQASNAVRSLSAIGLDNPWMANDQHGLCSEKWCPYWSICKGSRISDQDNNLEEIL